MPLWAANRNLWSVLFLTPRRIDLDLSLWSIQRRQSQAVAMWSKATMVTPGVGTVQLCTTGNCTWDAFLKHFTSNRSMFLAEYESLTIISYMLSWLSLTEYMHMQVVLIKQNQIYPKRWNCHYIFSVCCVPWTPSPPSALYSHTQFGQVLFLPKSSIIHANILYYSELTAKLSFSGSSGGTCTEGKGG